MSLSKKKNRRGEKKKIRAALRNSQKPTGQYPTSV